MVVYFILAVGLLLWSIYETLARDVNEFRVKISFAACIILIGLPLIGGIVLGILISIVLVIFLFNKRNLSIRAVNTTLLCLLVILIGYASYSVIIIRSSANPPMDQNSPRDVFSLASYLNREQYGERPLFYGHSYASEMKRDAQGRAVTKQGKALWVRKPHTGENEKDSYFVAHHKISYEYEDEMLFPRMYSQLDEHLSDYKYWGNVTDKMIKGKKGTPTPTFFQNIRFFFSYQLNFMYWRYFMWNFAGRQNDIQGYGDMTRGNWITGFNFIDNHILGLGDQSNLPSEMANNRGRNVFYMLPLLLGIIGLLYQAFSGKKGVESFWITFLLFFMTGIAIVLYLNQAPHQPRERDYAYAGSFYAFCIWIGLGVIAVAKLFEKAFPKTLAAVAASLLALLVPLQMVSQTWDDHDRSNRTTTPDFGYNYLESCEKDAIIFTNGDNDTFPLWYAQEVEGKRTDVRVCNLSYLNTDWYISQMKRYSYDSEPLPVSWTKEQYVEGKHDAVYLVDMVEGQTIDLEWIITKFLLSDDPQIKNFRHQYEDLEVIPAKKFFINIDPADVQNAGLMPVDTAYKLDPQIVINVSNKRALSKSDLIALDMLLTNKWKRPIYYSTTVGPEMYLGLYGYFSLEGMAYRVMPYRVDGDVNTDRMYDNIMNKFRFGNVKDPKVYIDANIMNGCQTLRLRFYQLAEALVEKGEIDKARAVLDRSMEEIPVNGNIHFDRPLLYISALYYETGEREKAKAILEASAANSVEYLRWYSSLSNAQYYSLANSDVKEHLSALQFAATTYQKNNEEALYKKHLEDFQIFASRWMALQEATNSTN
jgi:hypothetical protein